MISHSRSLRQALVSLLAASSMVAAPMAEACTRFVYEGVNGQVITGRSMDWKRDVGTNLWVFPRGM